MNHIINNNPATWTHVAAACEEDKSSIGGADFDPFALDWIAGVTGHYADGTGPSQVVDTTKDMRISAEEAFAYADAVHHSYDTPVSVDSPTGYGKYIFLGLGSWRQIAKFGSDAPYMFQNYAIGNNNYEVVVREGDHLQHYWFRYGEWNWHKGKQFASNVKSEPIVFQNHAPGNNNYEVVVREGDHLQHHWFRYGEWNWHKGKQFASNVKSNPAMFQNYAPGNNNYEVVVREGDHLQHHWFRYGEWNWHKGKQF